MNNSLTLEKRLRLVPFICLLLIFVLKRFIPDEDYFLELMITIALLLVSLGSFIFIIYLEKKDGRFNLKKYYLFIFFILISAAIFAFSFVSQ